MSDVIVRASITVAKERDISATWRFYKIAASTTTPTAPTEAQGKSYVSNQTLPTGWTTTEPAYDGTSTNSLYFCDLTAFTDGEVSWSAVSKSSSYEAAKQAYNEATAAQTAANNASKMATNYVSDVVSGSGVWFHEDDESWDETDNPTGVRITDHIDIFDSGDSIMSVGEINQDTSNKVVRIGKSGDSRAEIDYQSLQMIDKDGKTYFYISELSDSNSEYVTVSETFVRTEPWVLYSTDVYTTFPTPRYGSYSTFDVYVDDVKLTSNQYTLMEWMDSEGGIHKGARMSASLAPIGSLVKYVYNTTGAYTKAYTLGFRKDGSFVAPLSFVEGSENEASGLYSHCGGKDSVASGTGSFAHGLGLKVRAPWQAGFGQYNDPAYTDLFVIGNGTGDTSRSNAFRVDNEGNVNILGDIIANNVYSTVHTEIVDTWYGSSSSYHLSETNNCTFTRVGDFCLLTLYITTDAAIPTKNDIFADYILDAKYRPKSTVTSCTYYSNYCLPGKVNPAGEIVVRNANASTFPDLNRQSDIVISFVYIAKNR